MIDCAFSTFFLSYFAMSTVTACLEATMCGGTGPRVSTLRQFLFFSFFPFCLSTTEKRETTKERKRRTVFHREFLKIVLLLLDHLLFFLDAKGEFDEALHPVRSDLKDVQRIVVASF